MEQDDVGDDAAHTKLAHEALIISEEAHVETFQIEGARERRARMADAAPCGGVRRDGARTNREGRARLDRVGMIVHVPLWEDRHPHLIER